jgi:hypothetical protein
MGGYVALAARELGRIKKNVESAQRLKIPWWQQSLIATVGPEISGLVYDKRIARLDDLEAKARNSSGVGGEAALKKASNSTRAIMNQQLQSNIDTINTNFGTAGRYGSGANKQAVLNAQNSTNFNLANVVNQMSLQESQFQRNLDEERAWRQAQLDAGQPSTADKIGDIANLGMQLYGTNPDYFNQKLGGLGEKIGIGGDVYGVDTTQPVLQDTTGMQINPDTEQYDVTKPSFLDNYLGNYKPIQQTSLAPSKPISYLTTQPVEKPVSQWVEEDFSSNVSTLPTNPVDFFSSVDNIKTFSNSLSYVISNHLDDGELAQVSLEYSLTGDIGKVIGWLISKGVVLDGSSSLQSK